MKEMLMISMSIGATLLMLWAVMEYLDISLSMSLLVVGTSHLFVSFLFLIMGSVREQE